MVSDLIERLRAWCIVKLTIATRNGDLVFRQGEIWWCNIGMNIGEEAFGKGDNFTRPVLIFRKLTGNSFLGIPLTTKRKQGTWYVDIGNGRRAMLNQARILDRKRLVDCVGMISVADFRRTKDGFHDLYCL